MPFFDEPKIIPDIPGETPAQQFKVPIPKQSGKASADDIPSWARGNRPYVNENGKSFARRMMDDKYGPGNWDRINPEYKQIQKWGDRNFQSPKKIVLPSDEA